jgi:hypothetical protein
MLFVLIMEQVLCAANHRYGVNFLVAERGFYFEIYRLLSALIKDNTTGV